MEIDLKIILVIIKSIFVIMIFKFVFDLMSIQFNRYSKTPNEEAEYQLKKITGVSHASVAFASSREAFEPYKQACKSSKDKNVMRSCSQLSSLL